jgi:hypothetical protein
VDVKMTIMKGGINRMIIILQMVVNGDDHLGKLKKVDATQTQE